MPNKTNSTTATGAVTVADALAHCLAQWDVGAVYGVSGANIENFHDAIHRLDDERLVSIAARSENGAAFMADAHARVHGGIGVCCSTSGGGMMNLAVGVAEAYQEGIPMLAIVGQVPRRFEGRGGFQDSSGIGSTVDAVGMWNSISKEVRQIRSAETFWQDLHTVVSAAVNGRRGPGVLLIPKDVFEQKVPRPPAHWPTTLQKMVRRVPPPLADLDRLVAQLRRARRPVLVMGPMVRESRRAQAVHSFVHRMQIPVVTTLSDIGAFPNHEELYLGTIGMAGHPSAHRYINEEADLIIVAGTNLELIFRAPIDAALERCPTIFVDDDPSLAMRTFKTASPVIGDVEWTFRALLDGPLRGMSWGGRPDGYQLQRFLPSLAAPVQPDVHTNGRASHDLLQSEALMMLQRALPERGQILFDAGNCAASAMHYMTPPSATSTTIALGMGGMGYAIAGAIGAQVGGDMADRTVVVCGDGAFLMLGMEIHTAVDLGLPILFVVLNNGKHGMCVTRQQLYFKGRIECSQYARPSLAQVARGFGNPRALWVADAGDKRSLQTALDDLEQWDWHGPAVLELLIDAEEVPPFTPFLPASAPVGDVTPNKKRKQNVRRIHAA